MQAALEARSRTRAVCSNARGWRSACQAGRLAGAREEGGQGKGGPRLQHAGPVTVQCAAPLHTCHKSHSAQHSSAPGFKGSTRATCCGRARRRLSLTDLPSPTLPGCCGLGGWPAGLHPRTLKCDMPPGSARWHDVCDRICLFALLVPPAAAHAQVHHKPLHGAAALERQYTY
jgi:hypothetical protein